MRANFGNNQAWTRPLAPRPARLGCTVAAAYCTNKRQASTLSLTQLSLMSDLRMSLRELTLKDVEDTTQEIGRGAYGVVVEVKFLGKR